MLLKIVYAPLLGSPTPKRKGKGDWRVCVLEGQDFSSWTYEHNALHRLPLSRWLQAPLLRFLMFLICQEPASGQPRTSRPGVTHVENLGRSTSNPIQQSPEQTLMNCSRNTGKRRYTPNKVEKGANGCAVRWYPDSRGAAKSSRSDLRGKHPVSVGSGVIGGTRFLKLWESGWYW
jgi:hypothetical protein